MPLRKSKKSETLDMFLSDVMQELYPSTDEGLVENMEDAEKLQEAYFDLIRRFDDYYKSEFGVRTVSEIVREVKELLE